MVDDAPDAGYCSERGLRVGPGDTLNERGRGDPRPLSSLFKSRNTLPIHPSMERVSPPIRLFALVACLAAVGGLLFMFTAGRGGSDEAASVPVPPPAAAPPVAKKVKVTAPVTKARPTAKPQAKVKAVTPAKAAPKAAKPAVTIPASGFPVAVDAALRRHEVVVVSLVVPGARVDELAAAEARAGAKTGGVGFLALNVLNEDVAHALLTKLGGLEDPSLLVVKRPGDVVLQLSGFVDRQTVAQAAANASS